MPDPKYLALECSAQEWEIFVNREEFSNFLLILLKDIIEIRDLFEKQFRKTLPLANSINMDYEAFINDNLNIDIKQVVQQSVKFTIRRLKQVFDTDGSVEIRIILYLILIFQYEQNGSKTPFYSNVSQFINGVWKKDTKDIIAIVDKQKCDGYPRFWPPQHLHSVQTFQPYPGRNL